MIVSVLGCSSVFVRCSVSVSVCSVWSYIFGVPMCPVSALRLSSYCAVSPTPPDLNTDHHSRVQARPEIRGREGAETSPQHILLVGWVWCGRCACVSVSVRVWVWLHKTNGHTPIYQPTINVRCIIAPSKRFHLHPLGFCLPGPDHPDAKEGRKRLSNYLFWAREF